MDSLQKKRKEKLKKQDSMVEQLLSRAKKKQQEQQEAHEEHEPDEFELISSINSRSTINGINQKNAKNKAQKKDKTGVRALICLFLVIAIFTGFVLRLFDWQIVHGKEYRELSVASTSYQVRSEATRGEILDVNGKPLAVNVTSYNIIINKIYTHEDDINDIIITLINIMNECGVSYTNVLPISIENGAYKLDKNSAGDVEYIESESMLNREGLSAQEIVDGLAERYDAAYITDLLLRRDVVSVRYNMEKRGFSYENVYVFAQNVDSDVVAVVSERTQTIPAVEIRTSNERVIKNGTLIPHILGVVGAMSEEEYAEYKEKGYELNDKIGKFGIESALEDQLRGSAGEKTITKDANGNIVSEKETVKAVPGNTVYLTIDSRIQAVTNYSLAANVNDAHNAGVSAQKAAISSNASQQYHLGEDCIAGAAVMLDLRDFSVIAASSYPGYDVSRFYDPDYAEYLFGDETLPMFNRAFEGSFSPGSSFKPCVALAALQEGVVGMSFTTNCTGHYDYYKNDVVNCMHRHGELAMHHAMAQSCNYYFAEVGRRTGITTMYLYAEKMGLGTKTGLEVYESTGTLAGRDSTTWYVGNTVQAAIGQSDNTFTPVQLATYVATIANNGTRYRTHLVRKVVNYERDEIIIDNNPKKPEVMAQSGISKTNINRVKSAMREVLLTGTASECAGRYPIAFGGKTGTAENAGSDHIVFICFAPYENPEIAIAVVIEHGARGRYTQLVAMDMMDAYFYNKTLKDIQKKRWTY